MTVFGIISAFSSFFVRRDDLNLRGETTLVHLMRFSSQVFSSEGGSFVLVAVVSITRFKFMELLA